MMPEPKRKEPKADGIEIAFAIILVCAFLLYWVTIIIGVIEKSGEAF